MKITTNQGLLVKIQITEKAKHKLIELGVGEERFLRIAVQSGGCAGNSYNATIEDEQTEKDDVYFEEDTIRVVADQYSSIFLDGLRIDYSDDLIEPGFRLTNQNVEGSCGCGASFSV